jgi:hypothetical protein
MFSFFGRSVCCCPAAFPPCAPPLPPPRPPRWSPRPPPPRPRNAPRSDMLCVVGKGCVFGTATTRSDVQFNMRQCARCRELSSRVHVTELMLAAGGAVDGSCHRGVECASLRRPQRCEGWKHRPCYGTRGRAQAALTRAMRDFQLAVVTPAILRRFWALRVLHSAWAYPSWAPSARLRWVVSSRNERGTGSLSHACHASDDVVPCPAGDAETGRFRGQPQVQPPGGHVHVQCRPRRGAGHLKQTRIHSRCNRLSTRESGKTAWE